MHIINLQLPLVPIPNFDITNINFGSNANLLDADLIFWDMLKSVSTLTAAGPISQSTIDRYKNLIETRKKEFEEYFELGRSLFIVSSGFTKPVYTDSKNAQSKFTFDFFSCLEIDEPRFELTSGKNIQPIENNAIRYFLNVNKSRVFYQVKFLPSKATPLMYIKDTNYIVSQFYKVRNGFIIFLPSLIGINSHIEQVNFIDTSIKIVDEIKKISSTSAINLEEWAQDYQFKNEMIEFEKKENINQQIVELKIQDERQDIVLKKYNDLKILFSGSGKELEQEIEKVFIEFGFQIEEANLNRDDLIVRLNEKVAVIEIKGVNKSAGEKQAAQLEKWVSNYLLEKEISAKGILIVNTFRSIPLEERTEEDFPNQMLQYSKSRNHCLVTGIQLLAIYIDYKNGILDQTTVAKLLFETVGVLKYASSISSYLTKKSPQQN
jgi:hypothetical protein